MSISRLRVALDFRARFPPRVSTWVLDENDNGLVGVSCRIRACWLRF